MRDSEVVVAAADGEGAEEAEVLEEEVVVEWLIMKSKHPARFFIGDGVQNSEAHCNFLWWMSPIRPMFSILISSKSK